jgi:O-antigen/teichoic acid export membrane protein
VNTVRQDRSMLESGRRSQGRVGGFLGHLADPLFRHAYTLMVNTGLVSGLGLVYWVLAGRLYSPATVGRNAAVIASITFLAGVAQLNLRPVLSRFVPVAGRGSARLILFAYGISVVVAITAGLVYLATIDLWASSGPIPSIKNDAAAVAMFIAALVVWVIFALQDGVLIGLRSTILLTAENLAFSLAKIVVVVALAVLVVPPEYAITASWLGPMAVAVVAVNLLIFRRLIPVHLQGTRGTDRPISPARLVRFAAADYLGALLSLSYITLLPVIVINQAGEVAAAQFYIVWIIAASLQLLPAHMVLSLVVDTAVDPSTFRHQGRRMLIGMARILVPICVVSVIAAPLMLRLFGPSYEGATLLLRLLALSVLPYGINMLYLGRARVSVTGPRIVAVQAVLAGLILGLCLLLIPVMGVDGVGVAYLVGQGAVAAILLATVLRPLLTTGPEGRAVEGSS